MKLFTAVALQIVLGLGIILLAAPTACVCAEAAASVEQWDVFEVALKGPTDGNPFADVSFSARFTQGGVSKEVAGFYDGEGMYRVRFMPEQAGQWRYDDEEQSRGVGWKKRRVQRRQARAQESRTGASGQYVPLRVRRRHAIQANRHDLLCVDSSGRRAGGADARDSCRRAVQQTPHVRISQELRL